jgi:hypothetical protein
MFEDPIAASLLPRLRDEHRQQRLEQRADSHARMIVTLF